MLRKGLSKYISNPILGLLPFVLYLLMHASHVEELHALSISLVVALVGEFVVRRVTNTKMYSLTFYTSAIALSVTLLFWALTHKGLHAVCTYILFCEIVIVSVLLLIKMSKIYIATLFFREKSVLQKAWLNEFYHVVSVIQYGLMVHLFAVLIYKNFQVMGNGYTMGNTFLFIVSPIVILMIVGTYNIVRTTNLVSKLKREEWLPIVTEKGEVTGKIAKSVSLKMKNKFLHPIVRVALVSNGKVYIQERTADKVIDGGKLDYPFEKYMLFNHEINLAARNSISLMMGHNSEIPLKFLLKYKLENDETRRLVLLFVANVDDENDIKRTGKMKGKFWTVKQIEECFADEVFSESFELEFEYLKNTILEPMDMPIAHAN